VSDSIHTSARVARIDEVDGIEVAGGLYRPLRRALGVRAFGVNAYTARAAGDQLIERHDETGSGSGHHEEMYVLFSGRATFTVGEEEIDAPAGTVVFVPDTTAVRSAVATEPDTTALVIGGPADRPLPVSPFEYWFVAEGPNRRGDHRRAAEIVTEGLAEWPAHPRLHYHLACYLALAGDREQALAHLAQACESDARLKEWARGDEDFDSVRADPRFEAAVAGH
jgi:hypothetical protein